MRATGLVVASGCTERQTPPQQLIFGLATPVPLVMTAVRVAACISAAIDLHMRIGNHRVNIDWIETPQAESRLGHPRDATGNLHAAPLDLDFAPDSRRP